MKFVIIRMIVIVALIRFGLSEGTICNSDLLISFGLKGLLYSREGSTVCPGVKNTCCSPADELYIHKYFADNLEGKFQGKYGKQNEQLGSLNEIIGKFKKFNLTKVAVMFNQSEHTNHIASIVNDTYAEILNYNVTYGEELVANLTVNTTRIYKAVGKIREAFMCTLCDANTQSNIDLEDQSVIYSPKFCDKVKKDFFVDLEHKWRAFHEPIFKLDQVANLTMNFSFYTESEKKSVKETLAGLKKCAAKEGTPDCKDMCKLFYFNRHSPLFDGDASIVENIGINFDKMNKFIKPGFKISTFKPTFVDTILKTMKVLAKISGKPFDFVEYVDEIRNATRKIEELLNPVNRTQNSTSGTSNSSKKQSQNSKKQSQNSKQQPQNSKQQPQNSKKPRKLELDESDVPSETDSSVSEIDKFAENEDERRVSPKRVLSDAIFSESHQQLSFAKDKNIKRKSRRSVGHRINLQNTIDDVLLQYELQNNPDKDTLLLEHDKVVDFGVKLSEFFAEHNDSNDIDADLHQKKNERHVCRNFKRKSNSQIGINRKHCSTKRID